jgi:hypothetical protein
MAHVMDDEITYDGARALVTGTTDHIYDRVRFNNHGTQHMKSQAAIRSNHHQATEENRKKRYRTDIEASLHDSNTALEPIRYSNDNMSWSLGAGPIDPFVTFPIHIGSIERELLFQSMYYVH